MQIPGSIRKWRLERGYKQQYLANKLGITQQAFSDIENGDTKLKPEVAVKIAAILDIPIASIYAEKRHTEPLLVDIATHLELSKELMQAKDKIISLQEIIISKVTKGNKK